MEIAKESLKSAFHYSSFSLTLRYVVAGLLLGIMSLEPHLYSRSSMALAHSFFRIKLKSLK